ncbi:MAG: 3-keto-disaccharide hydrolase [Planctomycetota bacterium]|jgi:hypothetical protein
MKKILLALVAVLSAAPVWAAKSNRNKVWLDADRAAAEDPDFSIQGEYGSEKPGKPYGVQVVALGNGEFDAYVLTDGLPGAGWDKSKGRVKLSGKLQGGRVDFAPGKDGLSAALAGGKVIIKKNGRRVAALGRIVRKSPTLGAKPPPRAAVLFDGTNADSWHKGRMRGDVLMSGTTSKQRFGDFTAHLEFKLTYKPFARGQGRSNSGVYYHGRYETQVLDSFGLEGNHNECGGIYSTAPPILNMCFPPLTWQTYDVDFTAARFEGGKKVKHARMTVKLNGVVVHQDQECDHRTTASPLKEGPEPGPIHLQAHGNQVMYRNIWVVERPAK